MQDVGHNINDNDADNFHFSKQNISRLTQVKNEGRETWYTIFVTYGSK